MSIGFFPPGSLESKTQIRERFLGNLNGLLGDVRLLWTPRPTDTTTSVDETWNGSTLTADASMAGQLTALGNGYARTFNGTGNYLTTPDRANLSFGNGAADQAFSVLALANVTDTANTRTIVSKYATSNREWFLQIDSSDKLNFGLVDESAGVTAFRTSDAAITMGSWRLFGVTYSGAGGATAMNGALLWTPGGVVASTATNNASYVAMEDLASAVEIGSLLAHAVTFYQGQLALVLVMAGAFSAAQFWSAKHLINSHFGLSL